MAQAAPTKLVSYIVEPVTGGCDVIRPQFEGAEIRFRERAATITGSS